MQHECLCGGLQLLSTSHIRLSLCSMVEEIHLNGGSATTNQNQIIKMQRAISTTRPTTSRNCPCSMVEEIHLEGGTILGTSRGLPNVPEIVKRLGEAASPTCRCLQTGIGALICAFSMVFLQRWCWCRPVFLPCPPNRADLSGSPASCLRWGGSCRSLVGGTCCSANRPLLLSRPLPSTQCTQTCGRLTSCLWWAAVAARQRLSPSTASAAARRLVQGGQVGWLQIRQWPVGNLRPPVGQRA